MVHAAYWKYVVCASVSPSDEPFGEEGGDFFARPNGVATWEGDIAVLERWHGRLHDVVAACPVERLGEFVENAGTTVLGLFLGIAAHDAYHAGQIELIKRLHAAA